MIGSKIKRVAFSVPQQNLQAVTSVSQCIVDHPAISTFFLGYNANTGRYDTPHHLRYCFPSGHHALPVDYPQTTILDKWRQAVATNEVASLSDEQRAVMEDEIATYEKVDRVLLELRGVLQRRLAAFVNPRDDDQNTRLRDLLTLLKEAPSAKMSTAVDKLLWYANSIGHSADAKVCMKIGLAEFLRATPTMGLAAFQAAVDIDPEFTEAQSKLAGIYQYSKMSEQAMAHGMKAVVLMPKLYSTHMALGYVQHYTGHYDAATNSFRTALQLHPWAPDLVTTLQQMLNEQRAKTGNCAPNINTDPDKTTRPKRTKT